MLTARSLWLTLLLVVVIAVTARAELNPNTDANGRGPVAMRFDLATLSCGKTGTCPTRPRHVAQDPDALANVDPDDEDTPSARAPVPDECFPDMQPESVPLMDPEGKANRAKEAKKTHDKLVQCFCCEHFQALNYSIQRHFLAVGSSLLADEIHRRDNALAAYINDLNHCWLKRGAGFTAARALARIRTNFTARRKQGACGVAPGVTAMPKWYLVNEISASLWPRNDEKGRRYRQYVIEYVKLLKTLNNPEGTDRQVIVFAPFETPGAHSEDWSKLSRIAYVGPELYLSARDVADAFRRLGSHAAVVDYCRGKYQEYLERYRGVGVDRDRIVLTEHFGNTVNGREWGQGGLATGMWKKIIDAKCDAIARLQVAGFASYGWSFNGMLISDAERLECMKIYARHRLP